MKYGLLVLALLASGCGDSPTGPSRNTPGNVCPTGCQIPAGCRVEPSPANHPVGYVLLCD